eukprot:CAMPEP_0174928564 /NCGR_PEP_ID=MMETSP1355-20121228/24375_1 /TAXON_ID=464990 /ORGANISM="Hemiselmis tepida, Strain CCMP443" /LENGTH=68 /DNA_ID=CAMNT_0016174725 /DNA_START=56 /DNA_END=258 /DNA_ORIENTATION=-
MSSVRIPDPDGRGEWVQATDPSTGRTYYINHTTKATSWTAPSGRSSSSSAAVAQAPARARTGSGGVQR